MLANGYVCVLFYCLITNLRVKSRRVSSFKNLFQFAHPDSSESEVKSRETCTTTGIMQSQVKMSPQVFNFECYPKWKTQQVRTSVLN